ncbi:S1 RNA-binding domain-containing protein [Aliikangiella sp. IMCC44359]|uniref:S1 RNA-binding domain-containing protein n=1 Tax=Aliikangiella sp. IMCC44359 TaxID=3459125 RepID=UPI00403B04E3
MKVGEIVRAKVDQVEKWGVYLSTPEGRIFIQILELDWVKKIPDPREFTNIGEEFDVLILAVDERRQAFSGSIKQAKPELDPFKTDGRYEPGSIHSGIVRLNTEYGTFVEIAPGLEALIYNESGGNLEIGSVQKVKVILYDLSRRRMQVEISMKSMGSK